MTYFIYIIIQCLPVHYCIVNIYFTFKPRTYQTRSIGPLKRTTDKQTYIYDVSMETCMTVMLISCLPCNRLSTLPLSDISFRPLTTFTVTLTVLIASIVLGSVKYGSMSEIRELSLQIDGQHNW